MTPDNQRAVYLQRVAGRAGMLSLPGGRARRKLHVSVASLTASARACLRTKRALLAGEARAETAFALDYFSVSSPACATCASCGEVRPLTPTAPMHLPFATIGSPPSSGVTTGMPMMALRPPAMA